MRTNSYEKKILNLLKAIKNSLRNVSDDFWNLRNSLGGSYRENERLEEYKLKAEGHLSEVVSLLKEFNSVFQAGTTLKDEGAFESKLSIIQEFSGKVDMYFDKLKRYEFVVSTELNTLYELYNELMATFADGMKEGGIW